MQEENKAEVSVESHSHHQDGHARGGPIAEAMECNGIAILIYDNVAVLLYQQGHVTAWSR
jgi:hypothetical protein